MSTGIFLGPPNTDVVPGDPSAFPFIGTYARYAEGDSNPYAYYEIHFPITQEIYDTVDFVEMLNKFGTGAFQPSYMEVTNPFSNAGYGWPATIKFGFEFYDDGYDYFDFPPTLQDVAAFVADAANGFVVPPFPARTYTYQDTLHVVGVTRTSDTVLRMTVSHDILPFTDGTGDTENTQEMFDNQGAGRFSLGNFDDSQSASANSAAVTGARTVDFTFDDAGDIDIGAYYDISLAQMGLRAAGRYTIQEQTWLGLPQLLGVYASSYRVPLPFAEDPHPTFEIGFLHQNDFDADDADAGAFTWGPLNDLVPDGITCFGKHMILSFVPNDDSGDPDNFTTGILTHSVTVAADSGVLPAIGANDYAMRDAVVPDDAGTTYLVRNGDETVTITFPMMVELFDNASTLELTAFNLVDFDQGSVIESAIAVSVSGDNARDLVFTFNESALQDDDDTAFAIEVSVLESDVVGLRPLSGSHIKPVNGAPFRMALPRVSISGAYIVDDDPLQIIYVFDGTVDTGDTDVSKFDLDIAFSGTTFVTGDSRAIIVEYADPSDTPTSWVLQPAHRVISQTAVVLPGQTGAVVALPAEDGTAFAISGAVVTYSSGGVFDVRFTTNGLVSSTMLVDLSKITVDGNPTTLVALDSLNPEAFMARFTGNGPDAVAWEILTGSHLKFSSSFNDYLDAGSGSLTNNPALVQSARPDGLHESPVAKWAAFTFDHEVPLADLDSVNTFTVETEAPGGISPQSVQEGPLGVRLRYATHTPVEGDDWAIGGIGIQNSETYIPDQTGVLGPPLPAVTSVKVLTYEVGLRMVTLVATLAENVNIDFPIYSAFTANATPDIAVNVLPGDNPDEIRVVFNFATMPFVYSVDQLNIGSGTGATPPISKGNYAIDHLLAPKTITFADEAHATIRFGDAGGGAIPDVNLDSVTIDPTEIWLSDENESMLSVAISAAVVANKLDIEFTPNPLIRYIKVKRASGVASGGVYVPLEVSTAFNPSLAPVSVNVSRQSGGTFDVEFHFGIQPSDISVADLSKFLFDEITGDSIDIIGGDGVVVTFTGAPSGGAWEILPGNQIYFPPNLRIAVPASGFV